MRPAGWDRRSPQKEKDGQTDVRENIIVVSDGPVVRENTRVVPLSVEAEEFSLRNVPKIRVPTGEGSDGSGNCVLSREMHGGVVGRSDAVVSRLCRGGSPGRPCRNRCSGRCRNEIFGIDDERAPLVIRTSKQRPSKWILCGPVGSVVAWWTV